MIADMEPNFPPPCASNFLVIAVPFHIFLNMVTHTLFHEALRHVNSIFHRFRCRTPMANNTGAIDPQERCTAVLGSVYPLADIVQGRTHQNCCQTTPWGVGQASLEGL